eukprot:CAMPEP_0184017048 /NCGR_PEP_ID=MMETSP0954-20121128/7287_1 /TAXON_ID=627963 /ORGANISM="Aplanochytrium sp, Strain PBS07" /LENGTH=545 /DNA_ID=CAMNT_0026298175 /DNA_START=399 /DNA_END=2036 /DNA_ORIENTATION=-
MRQTASATNLNRYNFQQHSSPFANEHGSSSGIFSQYGGQGNASSLSQYAQDSSRLADLRQIPVTALDMSMAGMSLDNINRDQTSHPSQSQQFQHHPPRGNVLITSASSTNIAGEGSNTKATLYKTELCRKWITTGSCRYGAKCQFAHGESELRDLVRHPLYKTSMCKSFQATGTCRYGSRCRFIHDESEQQLQSLPRVASSNMVNGAANVKGNFGQSMRTNRDIRHLHMSKGQVSQLFAQDNSILNFPRVQTAPDNLANLLQANTSMRNPSSFAANWNTAPEENEYPHGSAAPVARQSAQSFSHTAARQNMPRSHLAQDQLHHSNATPSLTSYGRSGIGRAVMASSQQEETGLGFPVHLLDARDIPIAKENQVMSSAHSSYSSTASAGNLSTSTGLSSRSSFANGTIFEDQDVFDKQKLRASAYSMERSRSQPVLFDPPVSSQPLSHEIPGSDRTFEKAPGSPVKSNGTPQLFGGSFPSESKFGVSGPSDNPAHTQSNVPQEDRFITEKEDSGIAKQEEGAGIGRLDFFRSISAADLTNLESRHS